MARALRYEVSWLGLELAVPEDWEIVRHGVSAKRGSLIFVDRRRQRLELGWLAVRQEPDLDRWASDLEQEERRTQPGARLRELRLAGGWRAIQRTTESGEVTTRAVRYHADTAQLLEAVLETRLNEPDDRELLEAVLSRISVSSAPERARRTQAFDLDVEVPEPLRLARADVKPADVCFEFAGYDSERPVGPFATVRRMGMAEAWYDDDAQGLIRRRDRQSTFESFEPSTHAGHAATFARGLEAGPLAKRLLGMLRERRVLLWKCPTRNALFEISTLSPRTAPLSPEAIAVRCCGGKA